MNKGLKIALAIIVIIAVIVAVLFLVKGEPKETVKLDLAKVIPAVNELVGDEFDIFAAEMAMTESNTMEFGNMLPVYDFDFKEDGITAELEEYRFYVNEETNDMWIVFLPMAGQEADSKAQVDAYIKGLADAASSTPVKTKLENVAYDTEGKYQIWIVADETDVPMQITKNARGRILPGSLVEVNTQMLQQTFGVDPTMVEEVAGQVPMMNTAATMYLVINPVDGKEADVKTAMDTYMANYEKNWQTYLPDQYELVKARVEQEYEGYLIYVVGNSSDLIYNTIIEQKLIAE